MDRRVGIRSVRAQSLRTVLPCITIPHSAVRLHDRLANTPGQHPFPRLHAIGGPDVPILGTDGLCERLHLMPRYHFDLVNPEEVTDVTGAILDDDDQAEKIAQSLATDVRAARPDFIGKGCEIVVRTDEGNEIVRVSIDQIPKHTNGP